MPPTVSDVRSIAQGNVATPIALPRLAALSGDAVLVAQVMSSVFGSSVPGAPTDDSGNTYALLGAAQASGNGHMALYLAQNVRIASGGIVITSHPNFPFNACVAWAIRGGVYTGGWTASLAHAYPTTVGPPTATVPANSLMVAVATITSPTTLGDQAGWNATGVNGFTSAMHASANVADFGVTNDCWSMYNLVSGSPVATWPGGAEADGSYWIAMCASFAPAVAPTLTTLTPSSGAVGLGVTIAGASGFGATQGGSTVTFNGVVAPVTSWTASSIVVSVPTGATTGPVVVTVNGAASNGLPFTVSALPTVSLTGLSPTSGPVGTSVTLTGTNFGATQGGSTVTFNGTVAAVTSWSATSVVVTVPAGAVSGNVVLTAGGVASNGMLYTVTVPPPSYVLQMDGIGGVGLTSPANSTVSAIRPELKLDVIVTRTVVIEPNNVGGSSGGGTGGGETSVVF